MHIFCQLLSASLQQKLRGFAAAGAACHTRGKFQEAMLGANRKEKLKKRKKSRDRSQENRTSMKVRKFVRTWVFKGLGFCVSGTLKSTPCGELIS